VKDDRGLHGARELPAWRVDSYNLRIEDPGGHGFLGDLASQSAFREILERMRQCHRTCKDPFGARPSSKLSKKDIDHVLVSGSVDASHLVHLAVEEYARRLAHVMQVFLAQPEWLGVERILLGGGLPNHKAGRLAVRRAIRLLESADMDVKIDRLRHDPDEGGLLGWAALLPQAHFQHAAFLAVDIGGKNMRCGIIAHRLQKRADGGKARVVERLKWRHANDAPERGEVVAHLAAMLNGLSAQARTRGIDLAPFIGVACPGQIEPDGTLSQGTQNLPGNWERPFSLPEALADRLDPIANAKPSVVLHNDAVVQGISEYRRVSKARRWAALTIGTGLGNASFTNR
jgi:hypothetical protein